MIPLSATGHQQNGYASGVFCENESLRAETVEETGIVRYNEETEDLFIMRKREIGVSVYPDLRPFEEISSYLKLASKYGCTRVFSSMFSAEGTNEEIISYFRRFIACAHECGMKVSLDVNPVFMKKIGADYDDLSLFAEIECDIIRMDMSYGKEKDLILCRNPYGIQIQLNASFKAGEEALFLKENGVGEDRLMFGHNFYPQRYTALRWKNFLEINRGLAPYGYAIEAFVSSNAQGTHGVWDARDGLPTVEKLRELPIDLQARILFGTGNVGNLLIGNAYADESEFAALQHVLASPRRFEDSPMYEAAVKMGFPVQQIEEEKILKIEVEKDISENERWLLMDFYPQSDMGDSSEWIWRSRFGRFVNADRPVVPRHYDGEYFPVGSVLIVNDNYRHYAGEIQIARRPVRNDGQRNLVARLAPHEEEMLEMINDGDFVRFEKA